MSSIPAPVPSPRPSISPGRIFGYGMFAALVFVLGFAFATQARDGGFDGATVLAALIATAVLAAAVFVLALWISAIFDAASFTDQQAWVAAGYLRWVWVGVAICFGPAGALLWYAAVRPRITAPDPTAPRG